MIIQTEIKYCKACAKPVRGRSDKKFCDDFCRNNFNNQLKSATTNQMRNINNALSKNRRILEGLLGSTEETKKISRELLLEKGFQFKYITQMCTAKQGKTCYYCYDHGYINIDPDYYLIVRMKKEKPSY